ncbi:MAG: alpha/beta fold hydrolase, partial [Candidatus Micrarchaeota archaeon]
MELKTSDGMKIAATYYKSDNDAKEAIILLHMLNRNRNDWNDFARKLQPNYEVIAVDFRGHGDSGGDLNAFTAEDFQKFMLDVKAAREFLSNRGKKTYALIGGSIGANIALNFAVENDIGRVVLLSPGLDYRGVETGTSAHKYFGKA